MKKLLHKILTGNMSMHRLWMSGLGYLLGILIVLLSLNIYLQFQELLANKKSANFLMVSKQVKNISFKGDAFSQEEVEELKEQSFVKRLAPVLANQFGIWLDLDVLRLHTQALAEAMPDEFIDIELPLSWRKYSRRWDPESDFVPIIVSREMINMYNLSFALSNGTPQITDNFIYNLSGRIILRGNGKKKELKTSVVGLSERVNTILVPQTFLDWANKEYGKGFDPMPHKLLVEVENRSDPKIEEFFTDRGYEVEKSKLINQKNLSTLYVLLLVMVIFGITFIIFSMTIVVSNFALLIAEAKQEIVLLKTLGYKSKTISSHFFKYILKLETLTTMASFALLYVLNLLVSEYLSGMGFEVGPHVFLIVWLTGIGVFGVTLLISYLSLKNILKK